MYSIDSQFIFSKNGCCLISDAPWCPRRSFEFFVNNLLIRSRAASDTSSSRSSHGIPNQITEYNFFSIIQQQNMFHVIYKNLLQKKTNDFFMKKTRWQVPRRERVKNSNERSAKMLSKIFSGLESLKGGQPVKNSNITAPSDQKSDSGPTRPM